MGRDEVKQKFEQDKYLDGAEYMVRVLRDTGEKFDRLADNLNKILGENNEYTDMDGVTYKVAGANHMNKAEREALGDQGKDAVAIRDLFADEKFKGKPFLEAGRNPDAHFRVFCLANGISDEEMLAMAQENPPKEVTERIRSMRKPFVEMILNHDTEKMAYMYTNFVQNAMEKADQIVDMVDNPQGILDNKDNMLLYGNVQGYINQTLNLGGNPEPEETINLVNSIDQKLRQRGIPYSFRQFENFIQPLATILQTSKKDTAALTDEDIAEGKNDMLDPIVEDNESAYYKDVPTAVFDANAIANLAYRPYKEQRKALGSVEEAVADKDFAPLDYSRYNVQDKEATVKGFLKNVPANRLQEIADKHMVKTPEELRNQMQNHVRRTLGFKRANTEYYQAVLDGLSAITAIEHQLKTENIVPQLRKLREESLKKQYENLKVVTGRYLTRRDPNSTDGKERYRMVLEAEQLANKALAVETKKIKINQPEKKNEAEADNQIANQVANQVQPQVQEDGGKLKRANTLEVKKLNFKALLPEKKEVPKNKNPKQEEKQGLQKSNTFSKK